MKKLLFVAALLCSSIAFADNNPHMHGVIINGFYPSDTLKVVSNKIQVRNQFPQSITGEMGTFDVWPAVGSNKTIQYTKTIVYENSKGMGCAIQFAWDPDSKEVITGVLPMTPNSGCSVPFDGSTVYIYKMY